MRELTSDELKSVSGGLSAVREVRHPLLALIAAVVFKALGIRRQPPTKALTA